MNNRSINPFSSLCALAMASVLMIGCARKGPDQAGGKHRDSTSYGVSNKSITFDTNTHPAVVDTARTGRIVPLDPAAGLLSLKGGGPFPGEWKFDDVSASVSEQTRNGSTMSVVTIQAHKVPPDDHLKLYLRRVEGQIDVGTYSIDGDPSRQLDASWEHGKQFFRGLSGSKGSVEVTSLADGRIKGTFNVTIVPISGAGRSESLSGSFDTPLGH